MLHIPVLKQQIQMNNDSLVIITRRNRIFIEFTSVIYVTKVFHLHLKQWNIVNCKVYFYLEREILFYKGNILLNMNIFKAEIYYL